MRPVARERRAEEQAGIGSRIGRILAAATGRVVVSSRRGRIVGVTGRPGACTVLGIASCPRITLRRTMIGPTRDIGIRWPALCGIRRFIRPPPSRIGPIRLCVTQRPGTLVVRIPVR